MIAVAYRVYIHMAIPDVLAQEFADESELAMLDTSVAREAVHNMERAWSSERVRARS
jgi:hypothetical protein